MTHDDELIERVAIALAEDGGELALPWSEYHENFREAFRGPARTAITAVRAYDAERRTSVLDVDALKSFDPKSPGTLVWLPDGMPSIPAHDPDDYRDLPVAMTGPVRFRGGLTEKKRD